MELIEKCSTIADRLSEDPRFCDQIGSIGDIREKLKAVQGSGELRSTEVRCQIQELVRIVEERAEKPELSENLKENLENLEKTWRQHESATIVRARLLGYRLESFDFQDFSRLGEDVSDLDLEFLPVLALDSFDYLLFERASGARQFEMLLRSLVSLWGKSNCRIRMIQVFSEEPSSACDKRYHDPQEPLKGAIGVWKGSLSQPVEMRCLTEQDLKRLIDQSPYKLPEYVAREVYRETDGHPFLVQAFLYCALENSSPLDDGSNERIVDWMKALEQMKQQEAIQEYRRLALSDLPVGCRELVNRIKDRKPVEGVGTLPPTVERRGGKSIEVKEVISNLEKPSRYRGRVFRRAEDREIDMPYSITICGTQDRYVIAARFLWRILLEGRPPRLSWVESLPVFDLITLFYFMIVTFMFPALVLQALGKNWVWGFIFPFAVLVYELVVRWYKSKLSKQRRVER